MEKIAVMYSGGVDSTLVADMAATDADEIYLLTCISNCHLRLLPCCQLWVRVQKG